jgi:hypothetical protein
LSRTIPEKSPTAFGEKDVLIGNHAHGFEVVAVLPLTGCLLELLIGHQKAGEFVAHADVNPVAIGVVAIGTHGRAVPAPAVLRFCGSATSVEAATGKVRLLVQAGARIAHSIKFDNAAYCFFVLSAEMPAV